MKIKFVPQNIEIEIKPNESVLHAAQSHGVHIQSICKGVPSCTECRVRVVDGEFNVFPPNQKEITLIGNSYFVDQRRLSCQLKCFGDITVDLAEQVEKAEQSSASKRPRGARSEYDASTSQAKHGNIIFEGDAPPDAAVANAPVEAGVVADERMVEYESNLKRAENDLFAEETKRQLQQLKSGGSDRGPGTQQPARGQAHEQRRDQGRSQERGGGGNRNGQNQNAQGRNQPQGGGQNRDRNHGQNRNASSGPSSPPSPNGPADSRPASKPNANRGPKPR